MHKCQVMFLSCVQAGYCLGKTCAVDSEESTSPNNNRRLPAKLSDNYPSLYTVARRFTQVVSTAVFGSSSGVKSGLSPQSTGLTTTFTNYI